MLRLPGGGAAGEVAVAGAAGAAGMFDIASVGEVAKFAAAASAAAEPGTGGGTVTGRFTARGTTRLVGGDAGLRSVDSRDVRSGVESSRRRSVVCKSSSSSPV